MVLKHYFVPLLDVSEKIPFNVSICGVAKRDMAYQENSRIELNKFVKILERALGEKLVYIGMDVIGEKYYERFLFEKGGFFEIMMESPLAMNAHFTNPRKANKFALALKKSLSRVLPKKDPVCRMLLENIKANSEDHDDALTVNKWEKIKRVRKK